VLRRKTKTSNATIAGLYAKTSSYFFDPDPGPSRRVANAQTIRGKNAAFVRMSGALWSRGVVPSRREARGAFFKLVVGQKSPRSLYARDMQTITSDE
jgi:hypothetical protein